MIDSWNGVCLHVYLFKELANLQSDVRKIRHKPHMRTRTPHRVVRGLEAIEDVHNLGNGFWPSEVSRRIDEDRYLFLF